MTSPKPKTGGERGTNMTGKQMANNETEIDIAIHDNDDSVTWWLKPLVKPTREKPVAAIDQVEALCFWLIEIIY